MSTRAMGGQIHPINCFITPCCFHLTLKCAIEQPGKMVNIKGQPHSHGWYSILAYFILRCLELKLFCKWWGIVLVEQVQYEWALSSTRYSWPPKNGWTHLLFPITLTRACCVKSQLHRLKLHVPIDGPSTRPTNLEPHSWRGKLEPQLRDISHWKTERLARLSVIPKLTNVGV